MLMTMPRGEAESDKWDLDAGTQGGGEREIDAPTLLAAPKLSWEKTLLSAQDGGDDRWRIRCGGDGVQLTLVVDLARG